MRSGRFSFYSIAIIYIKQRARRVSLNQAEQWHINVCFATQRTESRFGWSAKGQGTSGVAPKQKRGPD